MALPVCAARMVQVPAATSVTVVPLTVHTAVVVDENVTASPDVVVALTVNAAVPYVLPPNAAKAIVCATFATMKLWSTLVAAAYVALPGCDARIVQVPAPPMVTVAPLTVQMVGVVVAKLTASPDEAVALTAKGAAPKVLPASAANVIVWLPSAAAEGRAAGVDERTVHSTAC